MPRKPIYQQLTEVLDGYKDRYNSSVRDSYDPAVCDAFYEDFENSHEKFTEPRRTPQMRSLSIQWYLFEEEITNRFLTVPGTTLSNRLDKRLAKAQQEIQAVQAARWARFEERYDDSVNPLKGDALAVMAWGEWSDRPFWVSGIPTSA